MKIRLKRSGTVFEFERKPMEIGRFALLRQLAGAAIGGTLLVS